MDQPLSANRADAYAYLEYLTQDVPGARQKAAGWMATALASYLTGKYPCLRDSEARAYVEDWANE
jgi:hypothetical protein